jgi:hypothetical protein
MTKKVLPPILIVLFLATGLVMTTRPDLIPFGSGALSKAVIVRETSTQKPLSQDMVELYAKAPSLDISVWDANVLGKDKQESAEAKPYLDAITASKIDLPVLAKKWINGKITVMPCPTKLDALKKEVGK